MTGKILTVSAHPDDWELGCGGTIERLKREGCEVDHFVMGGGRVEDPLDNQYDKEPLLFWVEQVEYYIEHDFKPDIIFTHYANDLNIDHRIIYQAVITAARPQPDCCVKEIYSFEVPSSTEWNFPTSFSPDVFMEISDEDVHKKIVELNETYNQEIRKPPHPRSLDGIEVLVQYRGSQCGCEYAEAFKTVRRII